VSTPYSSWNCTDVTSRGSFPGLRARMNPVFAAAATAPPSTNPRASAETT
jgi:hypothetical protein